MTVAIACRLIRIDHGPDGEWFPSIGALSRAQMARCAPARDGLSGPSPQIGYARDENAESAR
jgi:hypothetical protein